MRSQSAKNLLLATAFSSALVVSSSSVRKPESDPEFERLFVKERAEAIISSWMTKTGKELLKEEVRPLLSEFKITKGDTPAALAAKHSLALDEFVSLNLLFSSPAFSMGKKSPVLRIGETYYAATDPAAIRPFFAKVSRLEKADRVAEAIWKGAGIRKVREISGDLVFPKEPECIWLGEVLSSMLAMQRAEFDPPLPVIVDPRNERGASCANLMKNAFIQSCNLKYYSAKQRKMLLTENLHAWILAKKLRDEFGFEQTHASLMGAFNLAAFFSFNPITDPKKREAYDAEIGEVFAYLRDEAPQGTIVPMYFQWSESKESVMNEYRKADPHLNTHQTMFAGNIDWSLKASDIPVIRDSKRIPFWHDVKKIQETIADHSAAAEALSSRLSAEKEAVLLSLDPTKNPGIVRHMDSVPKLLSYAFKDPRLDAYLKKLSPEAVAALPESVRKNGTVDREAHVSYVRDGIRNGIMNGTLTIEGLRKAVPWYSMPEGDAEMFATRLSHASAIAEKRRQLFAALESGSSVKLLDYGPTVGNDPVVNGAYAKYAKTLSEIASLNESLAKAKEALKSPNDAKRSAIDMMIDFVAGRADFRSSFLPWFRNTVLAGFSRYPYMVEVEVNGKKLDMEAELAAFKSGKPITVVSPSDNVRLTGPMMLDGEKQATSDEPERRERMNARTRFFYEFAATIYLPTEVLSPKEGTLPERADFVGPESELLQKYLYSLRKGDTLASVLKNRIARYEWVPASDPKRVQKIAEHFKWQIRALKIDGFLQSESEFNVGAVNENRIIPYYDVRTVPAVWKRYLSDRRMAELEFEKSVALPYLKIATIDGAWIDSKRKIFREIADRVAASETRLSEYPALREIARFNEFQYELFMKRFFEESVNDSEASDSSEFFRDIRPNRNFYIRYGDLAAIAAEISDASALETPVLKPVDAQIIDLVIKNRHNASLAKNILVTETYSVDGGTWARKILKRLRWRSKGDYQIRMNELTENEIFVRNGTLFAVKGNGNPSPLEWPTLQNLRESADAVFQEDVYRIAEKNLSPNALRAFRSEAKRFDRFRSELAKNDLSQKETKALIKNLIAFMTIDPGDASNLVGKTFSTALLDSKVSTHYKKTSYWLSEMGIPFDHLADSDEERFKYERTVALVNNMSEDKVLMALLENEIIRILRHGVWVYVSPKDVLAKPSNPLMQLYQKITGQLYYERPIFFSHLRSYLENAKHAMRIDDHFFKAGTSKLTKEEYLRKKAVIEALMRYEQSFLNARNFNAEAFRFFRDPLFRETLEAKGLPWTPFPTVEELSEDPFRATVFNYIGKMERRISSDRKKELPAAKRTIATAEAVRTALGFLPRSGK